jgi:hypothetical protein
MQKTSIISQLMLASLLAIAAAISPVLLNPASAQTQSTQAQAKKMQTHAIGNVIFKTPGNWIDRSNAADDIVLHNQKPPKLGGGWAPKGSIKVTAQILNQDLDAATATAQKPNTRTIGRVTTKTEPLTIGGKRVVRLYQDYEDGFPSGIITFIATGEDETVMIVTFYSDRATEKQVQQIQKSIRITE